MFYARWWIRIVDYLVEASVVDRAAGLLLGTARRLGSSMTLRLKP
jgi:hypothetical protein